MSEDTAGSEHRSYSAGCPEFPTHQKCRITWRTSSRFYQQSNEIFFGLNPEAEQVSGDGAKMWQVELLCQTLSRTRKVSNVCVTAHCN